jgi:hypothetical protein
MQECLRRRRRCLGRRRRCLGRTNRSWLRDVIVIRVGDRNNLSTQTAAAARPDRQRLQLQPHQVSPHHRIGQVCLCVCGCAWTNEPLDQQMCRYTDVQSCLQFRHLNTPTSTHTDWPMRTRNREAEVEGGRHRCRRSRSRGSCRCGSACCCKDARTRPSGIGHRYSVACYPRESTFIDQ